MSTTICRRNMSALRSRLCSFRRINCTSTHQITKRTFYLYSPEPFHPIHGREPVWKSAEEAVEVIKSKQKVYVQGGAASPLRLITALVEHGKKEKLKDIEVIHAPTQLQCTFSHPENEGIFRTNSFYVSDPKVRQAIKEGRGDFIPIFLSEIPLLFRRGLLNLDVAMISLSPLDGHGFCSLGPNVDCTRSAVQNAKYIIGLVNENVPRTFGDGIIHSSHVDVMVESHEPLPEFTGIKLTPEIHEIARLIADDLVQDNATIQTGIGSLPNAVFDKLIHHKNLGIHTEMFSDGVIDLVEKGAITNAFKTIQTGKIVSSFALGTKRLYDFLDDNSFVAMCDCSFTNNISLICQNPRVTAINTCLEIDLTGQVCADSIGSMIYTGVGGQVDFIRGAALSLDGEGVPIIACPATAIMGDTITSRIVPSLKPGAGVVTTRAHVHYIVTEYGITNLFGKNLRQRAYELIKLAHPNYREDLEKAAFERLRVMPSP